MPKRNIAQDIDEAVALCADRPVLAQMLATVLEPYIVELEALHDKKADVEAVNDGVASLITTMLVEHSLHFTEKGDSDTFEQVLVGMCTLLSVRVSMACTAVKLKLEQDGAPPPVVH